jgi:hypothetical protein
VSTELLQGNAGRWDPRAHCTQGEAATPNFWRDLRLGSVAEVFFARWEFFGEDSFREKCFGFLFRDGWKDHHTVSILLEDIKNGETQSPSNATSLYELTLGKQCEC